MSNNNILEKWMKDIENYQNSSYEIKDYKYYNSFYKNNVKEGDILSIGIDEVGVTSIAGPLVGGIVALPLNHNLDFLPIDSKLLNDKQIEYFAEQIVRVAKYICLVGFNKINAKESNRLLSLNKKIWLKSYEKMFLDTQHLSYEVSDITIDGRHQSKWITAANYMISGDANVPSVSAAAIIAKYFTNILMVEYDKKYPGYEFSKNKGYESYNHIQKIKESGLTPIHRKNLAEDSLNKKWLNPEEFTLLSKTEITKRVYMIELYYEVMNKEKNSFIISLISKFERVNNSKKMHYYLDKHYRELIENSFLHFKTRDIFDKFKKIEEDIDWSMINPYKKEINMNSHPTYIYLKTFAKFKSFDYEELSKPIESYKDILYKLIKLNQYKQHILGYENKDLLEFFNDKLLPLNKMTDNKDKDFLRLVYLQLKNKFFVTKTQEFKSRKLLEKL